jgi:hypothetical protein
MKTARRDILKFAGGAAAGTFLTPLPWKTLDDVSIWTQNWSWIPKAPRGEVSFKYSSCTLCPAGCGVKARYIAGTPVSLAGVPGHPTCGGSLCTLGISAHHLRYHPARLTTPLRRGAPIKRELAVEQISSKLSGRVAIVDGRPGRTLSALYERFATLTGGRYVALRRGPFAALESAAGVRLGVDIEHTKTLVSIGVPLLESWAAPGRVFGARPNFKLIQVEPWRSRTGALANEWVRVAPGGELDYLVSLRARNLEGPTIVLAAGDAAAGPFGPEIESAVAAINLELGSVGIEGGFVPRRGALEPADVAHLEDAAADLIIVDRSRTMDTLPLHLIRRKLAPGGIFVAISTALDEFTRRADFAIPAPAVFEALEDVPAPFDAVRDTFALSAPLATPPAEIPEFTSLFPQFGSVEAERAARIAALLKNGRGSVYRFAESAATPLSEFAGTEALTKALFDGGVWVDDMWEAPPRKAAHIALPSRRPVAAGLRLVPAGSLPEAGALPPLLSKAFHESNLNRSANHVLLHPDTAAKAEIASGTVARIETASGELKVLAFCDQDVHPDCIMATAGPLPDEIAGHSTQPRRTVLDLCEPDECGVWRNTPVRISKA